MSIFEKLKLKDFFSYNEGDKRAIILLSVLIIICGGICLFSEYLFNGNQPIGNSAAFAEFDKLQKNRIEAASSDKTMEEQEQPPLATNNNSTQLKKLAKGEVIDINNCNAISIKQIPGIGNEYAKRIITYRNKLGGFVYKEQLMEVKGISRKRYDNISQYVIIKKGHKAIDINNVTEANSVSHPYLKQAHIAAIIKHIENNGRLSSTKELSKIPGFTSEEINKLSPYLSFE
ncbi:hypothetical protein D0T53_07140 [Dysgonomonas sp. 216]|uniref:helix-hairpin-helix domain-containing protein n=1 Tax=Dysgonomonas sp. 216 TaxID=2302934 RepID=UPI0013D5496A|nr:helix-hairpin-helix domain-containing protein [Dysgonomonas sp. 216]NDW18321.1 hypothetical protein [Dysgonomonas sp. 216]NDW18689.1 hypothetical protein [Dysgonomonas sp. 216]